MIELKNLLLEANNRITSLSLEEAIDCYEANCRFHNSENTQIYRGVFNKPDIAYINPKKSRRDSSSSSGFYSLIIDNSGFWSGYPKRSRSLICSPSRSYSSNFGTVYLVIPFDNSNFGVCPEEDIWRSFDFSNYKEFSDLSEFDTHLNKISNIILDKDLPSEDFKEFRSMLFEIGRKAERGEVNLEKSSLLRDYIESDVQDFLFYLEELLNPKRNNFKTKNYDSSFDIFGNRELWTDGECLMIKNSIKREFLSKIKSN